MKDNDTDIIIDEIPFTIDETPIHLKLLVRLNVSTTLY